jgi:fumarate reductase subunit D
VFPGGYCTALNIGNAKTTVVASFITDIILLVIMLVGLFRLEFHRKGAMATGRFLWNQVQ